MPPVGHVKSLRPPIHSFRTESVSTRSGLSKKSVRHSREACGERKENFVIPLPRPSSRFRTGKGFMTWRPIIESITGRAPVIDGTAYIAPSAAVVGEVTLGARSSVWYGAVLRADGGPIVIGANSNIQDNCTVHADPGFPVSVGEAVSVGHNAVLHGCTVEDGALIGMSSTVLNGAHIGAGSLVAAQALVPQGLRVPPGMLVAGVPARARRPLTADEAELVRATAASYVEESRRRGLQAS